MVVIKLKKNTVYNKMFVESWYFLNKERVVPGLSVTGVQAVIDEKNIPNGFYTNPRFYYLEDGNILRNGKFMVS